MASSLFLPPYPTGFPERKISDTDKVLVHRLDWVPEYLPQKQRDDFVSIIIHYAFRAKLSPAKILKGGRHRRFLMWRRAAQCDLVDMGHSFRAVAKMFTTDDGTIKNNVERERRLRAAGRSPASPPAGQLPAAGPSSPAAGALSGGAQ